MNFFIQSALAATCFLSLVPTYAGAADADVKLQIAHSRAVYLFRLGQEKSLSCMGAVPESSVDTDFKLYNMCAMHEVFPCGNDKSKICDNKNITKFELDGVAYEGFMEFYYTNHYYAGAFIDHKLNESFDGSYIEFCNTYNISCAELKDYYTNQKYYSTREAMKLKAHP